MRKIFISLLCVVAFSDLSIVSAGVTASTANLSDEEKITKLFEDIDQLSEVIEIKKREIKQLNGEIIPEKDLMFEDVDVDVSEFGAFDSFENTIVRQGINYESEHPVAFWIIHTKIIGSEKQFPSMAISGGVTYENSEYIEWADSSTNFVEKDSNGNFHIAEEPPFGRAYAPGWEGYYMVQVTLDDPNAEYMLAQSTNDYGLKIPVYSFD